MVCWMMLTMRVNLKQVIEYALKRPFGAVPFTILN